MTTYARIDNDKITRVGLPRTGFLADGRAVSGYDQLPADVLQEEGWHAVTDTGPPEYDPETHRAERELTVEGDEVVATYTLVELEDEPDEPEDPTTAALTHAARLAVADKVKADGLSGDDLARIAIIFPLWQQGGTYKAGDLHSWDHTVIEALQDHTNHDPNHTPDATPALWKLYTLAPEPGQYPLWVQPGSTNPYNATWDDGTGPVIVRHNDKLWENTHGDGNVWPPGPGGFGWTEVNP